MSQRSKPLNHQMLELVADRFKLLGDPARLRILQTLDRGEASVGELVAATEMVQSSVSRHLQILLRGGLVSRRKDGLFVYYKVADPSVMRICDVVCGSLVDRFSRDLSTIQGVRRRRS